MNNPGSAPLLGELLELRLQLLDPLAELGEFPEVGLEALELGDGDCRGAEDLLAVGDALGDPGLGADPGEIADPDVAGA